MSLDMQVTLMEHRIKVLEERTKENSAIVRKLKRKLRKVKG